MHRDTHQKESKQGVAIDNALQLGIHESLCRLAVLTSVAILRNELLLSAFARLCRVISSAPSIQRKQVARVVVYY